MATLSGQKIKNAFASLLKLSTNTATTTLKNVESGDGVATALQLATGKVGVNGTLEFPTVPATGSTETSALLLNASNQVVKRTLNAAAFSGGAVTTATLPLAITSSTVRLDNPASISDIGSIASTDRFLVWDASASVWKRIDYNVLSTTINPSTYQSAPELVCRVDPAIAITTSNKYLDFAAIGSSGSDTVEIGNAATIYTLSNVYGGTRDAITINEDGVYAVTLSANLTTSAANETVFFYFNVNGAVFGTSQIEYKTAGSHLLTQSTIPNLQGGDILSVETKSSSGNATLNQYSALHLRKL
jgi:hypothetical protein